MKFQDRYNHNNECQKRIHDLTKENTLLKEAALFHQNKYLHEKKHREILQQKLSNCEKQKCQLLKKYTQLLDAFEQKNSSEKYDLPKSQPSVNNILDQNYEIIVSDHSISEQKKKQDTSTLKIQTFKQDPLVHQYLEKKLYVNQHQQVKKINSIKNIAMKSQEKVGSANHQNDQKLKTLKEVSDVSIAKLHLFPHHEKPPHPHQSSRQKRKNYFEKMNENK